MVEDGALVEVLPADVVVLVAAFSEWKSSWAPEGNIEGGDVVGSL